MAENQDNIELQELTYTFNNDNPRMSKLRLLRSLILR